MDHRERQIAPHSMAFNPSATKYVLLFLILSLLMSRLDFTVVLSLLSRFSMYNILVKASEFTRHQDAKRRAVSKVTLP